MLQKIIMTAAAICLCAATGAGVTESRQPDPQSDSGAYRLYSSSYDDNDTYSSPGYMDNESEPLA